MILYRMHEYKCHGSPVGEMLLWVRSIDLGTVFIRFG